MPLPMPTLAPADQLEELFEKELECTSRAKHTCTVKAVAVCTSECNNDTKLWCEKRYAMYLENKNDYSIVCSVCHNSIPRDWHVHLI